LIVYDDSTIYGYGRAGVHWSNQLQDGPYRAFALKRDDRTELWTKDMPIQIRAMVLADKVLFMAGPVIKPDSWFDEDEDHEVLLIAISVDDGVELARYPLDCSPVFDGMAAANGRLYISLENGHVVCMGEE
jgi:hypothetical protein